VRVVRRCLAVLTMALVAVGCGGDQRTDVRVLAASSLTDALGEVERTFEAQHHDVDLQISFAGTATIVTQVREGVTADIVVSASRAALTGLPRIGAVTDLARNRLEIAVAPGNPRSVAQLSDLTALRVALCQPQVPCGALAHQVLDDAGVHLTPVTEEPDVRATLGRVLQGEADAALVYATDVVAAGTRVSGVAVTSGRTTALALAPLMDSRHRSAADQIIAFLTGDAGQRILRERGFLPP
jgi:molybdate transport system substrate-binding protein